MKISSYKSTEKQAYLFDQPLGNHGHVRTVAGDLAERLTARYTGGKRHKTQSNAEYCPDVSSDGVDGLRYYESKTVGRSKTGFIYAGRLQKDIRFAQQQSLTYVIWHHVADTKEAVTVNYLERLLLHSMRELYLIPFSAIAQACENLTPDRLNSKYGNSDNQDGLYGSGYRLRLSLFDAFVIDRFPNGLRFDYVK